MEPMRSVKTAVAEPHAVRADRWRETLDSTFDGLDVRLDRVPDARDRITVGQAGPVQVIDSMSGPGQVRRTARHLRRHDPARYLLFVQVTGSDVGEHLGHCAEYRPGDLGVLDLSAPLRCTHDTRRAVMLTYPKSLCPLGEGQMASLAGVRIDGKGGTAAPISGL